MPKHVVFVQLLYNTCFNSSGLDNPLPIKLYSRSAQINNNLYSILNTKPHFLSFFTKVVYHTGTNYKDSRVFTKYQYLIFNQTDLVKFQKSVMFGTQTFLTHTFLSNFSFFCLQVIRFISKMFENTLKCSNSIFEKLLISRSID